MEINFLFIANNLFRAHLENREEEGGGGRREALSEQNGDLASLML